MGQGRPKGSPNKKTVELVTKLQEANFDPVKEFLENYLELDTARDRVDVILKFMEYIYPKRTRVEGELEVNDISDTPRVTLTQENIIQFIQAARDSTPK